MGVLSAVMSVVSGVIGAMGAMQQADAQANAANYNAQVQERNMIIEDQNRKAKLQAAGVEADDKRRENRRLLATMRTAYGASGVELAGSPLDVLEDTAVELELDASRIEYQGRVENRESAVKFLELGEKATLSRMEASAAKSAGRINAIGSIVGGIGSAAGKIGSGLSMTG